MKRIILTICTGLAAMMAAAQSNPASVNLAEATIVYNEADAPLVKQMAQVLADARFVFDDQQFHVHPSLHLPAMPTCF